jgi:hypothetical protein
VEKLGMGGFGAARLDVKFSKGVHVRYGNLGLDLKDKRSKHSTHTSDEALFPTPNKKK